MRVAAPPRAARNCWRVPLPQNGVGHCALVMVVAVAGEERNAGRRWGSSPSFPGRCGGIVCARNQFLAPQHGTELLDALGRPVGEVLESSLLGLAVLAVAFAQQDGWR